MSGASYHNAAALRAMSILETALQDMQEELPTQMALAAKSQQDAPRWQRSKSSLPGWQIRRPRPMPPPPPNREEQAMTEPTYPISDASVQSQSPRKGQENLRGQGRKGE